VSVQEGESGLISIYIEMEEPKLAADIANHISDYVFQFVSAKVQEQSKENRRFIEEQLNRVKFDLSIAEENLTEFRKKFSPSLEPPERKMERSRLIRKLDEEQQIYVTLRQQYEIARIEEEKIHPQIILLDVAEPSVLKSRPRRTLIVVLSTFAGLFICLIGMFLREIAAVVGFLEIKS